MPKTSAKSGAGHNIVELALYRKHRKYSQGGRIEKRGDTTYRYNASGQRIEKKQQCPGFRPKRWRYSWNSDGQLSEVHTPDNTVWQYHYDPFGRLINKQQKHLAHVLFIALRVLRCTTQP